MTGTPDAVDTITMLRVLGERFLPNKVVLFVPNGGAREVTEIASYAEDYRSIDEKATAYVCLNYTCALPTTDHGKMLELLDVKKP